jgi:hypothetical protein
METHAAFPGAHALPAELSAAFRPDLDTKITIVEAKGKRILLSGTNFFITRDVPKTEALGNAHIDKMINDGIIKLNF